MTILALDSSTSQASVALVRDGETVREVTAATPRSRGAALFTSLQSVLEGADELTRVVVGIGPGGYNGIRSALAAGWGIATARKVPLVGVSSLLALGNGTYCAVGDARRGQFFLAVVEEGVFRKEPVLLEGTDFLAEVAACGGLPVYASAPMEVMPEVEIRVPMAAQLAVIGAVQAPALALPEPIYLKPAYINTATKGR